MRLHALILGLVAVSSYARAEIHEIPDHNRHYKPHAASGIQHGQQAGAVNQLQGSPSIAGQQQSGYWWMAQGSPFQPQVAGGSFVSGAPGGASSAGAFVSSGSAVASSASASASSNGPAYGAAASSGNPFLGGAHVAGNSFGGSNQAGGSFLAGTGQAVAAGNPFLSGAQGGHFGGAHGAATHSSSHHGSGDSHVAATSQSAHLNSVASSGYASARPSKPFVTGHTVSCHGKGKMCVTKEKCLNGYIAADAVSQIGYQRRKCDVASEVCCTVEKPTPAPVVAASNNAYLPPVVENNGYLPPIGTAPSDDSPNYAVPPLEDEDDGLVNDGEGTGLSPNVALPPVLPKAPLPQPQLGCAAALICVEEQYCTMTGMISKTAVQLSESQLLRRVPMVDCRNPDNGVIGKCCRDPDYVDPWPAGNIPAELLKQGFDEQGFPKYLNLSQSNKPKVRPVQQQQPLRPLQPSRLQPAVIGVQQAVRPQSFSQVSKVTPASPRQQQLQQEESLFDANLQFNVAQSTKFGERIVPAPQQVHSFHRGQSESSSSSFVSTRPEQPHVVVQSQPSGLFTQQEDREEESVEQQNSFGQQQHQFHQEVHHHQEQPHDNLIVVDDEVGGQTKGIAENIQQFTTSLGEQFTNFQNQVQNIPSQIASQVQNIPAQFSQFQNQVQSIPGQIANQVQSIPAQFSQFQNQVQSIPGQIASQLSNLNPFRPQVVQSEVVTGGAEGSVVVSEPTTTTTRKPFFSNFPIFGGAAGSNGQGKQHYYEQQQVVTETGAPVILSSYAPGSRCGVVNKVQHSYQLETDETAFGEITWQAMVLNNVEKKLLCSGAIVAPNVVVTAAHCVNGINPRTISVKAGEWKLGYELEHEEPLRFEIAEVETVVAHPNYKPGFSAYDIAVLYLSSPVKLAQHIDTICVADSPVVTPQRKCISTGWGKVAVQHHAAGALMHKIDLDLLANEQCRQRLQNAESQIDIDDSLVCAKAHRQNNNLCQVDVGGPLACDRGDGSYELVGIYSQDTGCLPTNQVATFALIDSVWVNDMIVSFGGGRSSSEQHPQQTPSRYHYHKPGVPCDCQQGSVPAGLNQYLPPV